MHPEPVFEVYLPLKILDSLSLGIPVIFGGRGEGRHVLKSSKGGAVFSPGDSNKLVELIKERMTNPEQLRKEGQSGLRFVNEHFSRNQMAQKYLRIIKSVACEAKLESTKCAS